MGRSSTLGVIASSGAATVFGLIAIYACGGGGAPTSASPAPPDGATPVAFDGAVADADGSVITPDTAPSSKVSVTNETVTVAGGARAYVLSVPTTYAAARKYPLIVALHGDGQDANGFRVFLGLDEISGDDAIMAYPDQAVDLYTPYDQNADQQLIEAVITAVKGKLSIDAAKVWGLGYSKGGFMVNEIACRKPGLLKAMAAHATGAPEEPRGVDGFPQCPGVMGLPVMTSEGDRDVGIGADYAANYWASVNGCSATRTPTTPSSCQKHNACPSGKPVVFCVAPGVSHYPIWRDAAQVSWDFFRTL